MAKSQRVKRKQRLLKRDGFDCYWCGKRMTAPTVDHLVPLKAGGTNCDHNLVMACIKCNQDKADMMPEEFVRQTLSRFAKIIGSRGFVAVIKDARLG